MEKVRDGKHGTHCTKMGADSLAENTLNAPEFICPICLPKPRRLHWLAVVRWIRVKSEHSYSESLAKKVTAYDCLSVRPG